MTDDLRRCSNCGKSVDELPYELWLFHSCRSCVIETSTRWPTGMAPGTEVKWCYTPRWHLDRAPGSNGRIVADGGESA